MRLVLLMAAFEKPRETSIVAVSVAVSWGYLRGFLSRRKGCPRGAALLMFPVPPCYCPTSAWAIDVNEFLAWGGVEYVLEIMARPASAPQPVPAGITEASV